MRPLVWTPTVPVILTRVLGPTPLGHWAGPTTVRQQPTSCRTPTASQDLHPPGPMWAPEATWRGTCGSSGRNRPPHSPWHPRLTSGLEPMLCVARGGQVSFFSRCKAQVSTNRPPPGLPGQDPPLLRHRDLPQHPPPSETLLPRRETPVQARALRIPSWAGVPVNRVRVARPSLGRHQDV